MKPLVHPEAARYPTRARWVVTLAWLLIALKCWAVWWAIGYWHVPFHPFWIIGPTVMFAAMATALWLTHHEE